MSYLFSTVDYQEKSIGLIYLELNYVIDSGRVFGQVDRMLSRVNELRIDNVVLTVSLVRVREERKRNLFYILLLLYGQIAHCFICFHVDSVSSLTICAVSMGVLFSKKAVLLSIVNKFNPLHLFPRTLFCPLQTISTIYAVPRPVPFNFI